MQIERHPIISHPLGEQPSVEALSATADTYAGRVHIEWDAASPVKTLYGHQEGAEVGYNPAKPGWPSHAYHTDMPSSLRLVLRVDVLPGDEYNVVHATDGLWSLLDHLGPTPRPALPRGDKSWGIERVMARAEIFSARSASPRRSLRETRKSSRHDGDSSAR